MIRPDLFPPEVCILQCDPHIVKGELYPAEEALIGQACAGRQQEFRAGRLLARALLYEMGITDFPILIGNKRQPVWPETVCGSITHLSDICVVAVAKKKAIRAVGVDVARITEVRPEIWPTFLTEEELAWVDSLPSTIRQRYAAMMFSAKETLFKCFFPEFLVWIDFKDVRISTAESYGIYRRARFQAPKPLADPGQTQFEAVFLTDKGNVIPGGFQVSGRYLFDGPYVFTSMILSHSQAPGQKLTSPDNLWAEEYQP